MLSSEPANVIAPESSLSATKPLKVQIGCGHHRLDGYINCDLYRTDATDKVFDCTSTWPFKTNSVETIYCSHTLEHLHDYRTFFQEAHRVLTPGGNLQLRLPYGGHKAAYWDLTHVRPWYAESFCFLQPGYGTAIGNVQHQDWSHFFSVEDVVLRVTARLLPVLRWTLLRKLLLPWLDLVNNSIEEMWVYLRPLKTDQAVAEWSALHPGNAICARYSVYRHHLENRRMGAHEVAEFVDWRREMQWNGFHNWKEPT